MKTKYLRLSFLLLVMLGLVVGCQSNQEIKEEPAQTNEGSDSQWSNLENLPFNGFQPEEMTVERLYDELDFQRAVQVYLWALPAMNMIGMRDGLKSTFNAGDYILPIWKDRINANSIVTTPNPDVIYAMTFVDLKNGPMVLEAPANLQGLLDDIWHRPICDIGAAGPDEGKGGKFLLVPPGYNEKLPDNGYYVQKSSTYGVFVFLRGFLVDGKTEPAVELLEQTRIYPYQNEKSAPAMQFPNASPVKADLDFRRDIRYFESLSKLLNEEYEIGDVPSMLGLAAAIGIEKGKPFNPDERMKKIFNSAANVAYKMATVISYAGRDPNLKLWPDRQWETVFLGGSPVFMGDDMLLWDARIGFFHKCYSTSNGMVEAMPGKGAQYIMGYRDSKGEFLKGENYYKLHVEPGVPAENYWSLVYYDADTRSLIDNGESIPSVSSNINLKTNEDGSADIYFGPTAPDVPNANWIKTVPGRGYLGGFRLYSPSKDFFDRKWKPNDLERIK